MDSAVPVLSRHYGVVPKGVLAGAKPEVGADCGPQRRKTYQPDGFLNEDDFTWPGNLGQAAFHDDSIRQITGGARGRGIGAIAGLLRVRTGIDFRAGRFLGTL